VIGLQKYEFGTSILQLVNRFCFTIDQHRCIVIVV